MTSLIQDCAPLKATPAWRRLHVFDLDHTLLTENSSALFFRFLAKRGCFSWWERLQVMACGLGYKAKCLSIEAIHHKIFQLFYAGQPIDRFSCYLEEFLSQILTFYSPPLHERLRVLQAEEGTLIALFSASPEILVGPIARLLGLKVFAGSRYPSISSSQGLIYDKEGEIQVISGQRKAAMLVELAEKYGISLEATCAYSDHEEDLPLLEKAGKAVVVSPGFKLARIARARGWQILSHSS